MPVPVQEPVTTHVGNGVSTAFSFDFYVELDDDLVVQVDGVEQLSGYSLSGLKQDAGGTVTFFSPPASLAQILLYRETGLKRDTNYQTAGDFLAQQTVNPDFDRTWRALQDLVAGNIRQRNVLQGAVGEEFAPVVPSPNLLLGWDALGQPANYSPAFSGSVASAEQLLVSVDATYARGTAASRLNDVFDLRDFLIGDGITNNDARLVVLLAHMVLHPGFTYRGHKGDIYRCTISNATIPGTVKLRLEGARFLWSGDLSASGASILTLASGCDFDAVRMEIVSGGLFRRAITLAGSHRGDLVELIAQSQINNLGGSNLDRGVRLYGQANKIGEIKVKNVDYAAMIYGEGATASTTQKDTVIGFVDIENYATGLYPRNVERLNVQGYNIRGRSANATPDPGFNGIVTAGILNSMFGPGRCDNAGEHAIRVGGSNGAECLTDGVTFTNPSTFGSGQTGFKVWCGSSTAIAKHIKVIGGQFIDCHTAGVPGDPGFNDFGMMVQNAMDSDFIGCTVGTALQPVCGLDGVYVSQPSRVHFEGLKVYNALRNGLRLSEYNAGGGLDSQPVNTFTLNGFSSQGHGAAGVLVECPTADMRDIFVTAAKLIGGTNGVEWTGSALRAKQMCYFQAGVRGHSGLAFSVPSGTFTKTLDLFA